MSLHSISGVTPEDNRFCYGATCTWFGSIHEVGTKGTMRLPCCPACGGVLFEMGGENEWWTGVDQFERAKPHPGYRAMLEWQRTQKKCFPQLAALIAAHRASQGERYE